MKNKDYRLGCHFFYNGRCLNDIKCFCRSIKTMENKRLKKLNEEQEDKRSVATKSNSSNADDKQINSYGDGGEDYKKLQPKQ